MTLTYKGETMTIAGWARRAGINHSTLSHRLALGWSMKDALETPLNKVFGNQGHKVPDKNSCELWLNDCPKEKLPKELAKLVEEGFKGKKFGHYLRENHREAFNHWFESVYSKQIHEQN